MGGAASSSSAVDTNHEAEARRYWLNEQVHKAAKEGDVETLKKLLCEGDVLDSRDQVGNTPLMSAVEGGFLENKREVVEFLLSKHCDLNILNREGLTALIYCSMAKERLELMQVSRFLLLVCFSFAESSCFHCQILLNTKRCDPNLGERTTPLHECVNIGDVAATQVNIVLFLLCVFPSLLVFQPLHSCC